MNRMRKVASVWSGVMLGTLTLGVLLLWTSVGPVTAEERSAHAAIPALAGTVTPTLTPTPAAAATRSVGWMNQTSSRAPSGLQRTVQIFGGGGGEGAPDACQGVLLPKGSKVWAVYPAAAWVLLGRSDASINTRSVVAAACGSPSETGTVVTLRGPDGKVLRPEEQDLAPTHREPYVWWVLPEDAQPGTYILSIRNRQGTLTDEIQVSQQMPRLILHAERETDLYEVAPGQKLRAVYLDYQPGQTVEAGLYHSQPCSDTSCFPEMDLIDVWQFVTDAQGSYREEVTVPEGAPSGSYYWAACVPGRCGFAFMPDSEVQLNWVWQSFSVASPSESGEPTAEPAESSTSPYIGAQAVVDPVTAWDGLNVRTRPGPSFEQMGVVRPNGVVVTLDGPVMANASSWYLVEDTVTGLTGWVNGNYLKPLAYSPWDDYYSLSWVSGCDARRIEVALLREGQDACMPGVGTRSLQWLTTELRTLGLLASDEQLAPVALGGKANQGLEIRSGTRTRLGWIRIGGDTPVGGVWRIPYAAPERQIGRRCWLFLDEVWRCE
jgi:hypothetical protein